MISKRIQQEVLDGYGLKPIEASELLSSYKELEAERDRLIQTVKRLRTQGHL